MINEINKIINVLDELEKGEYLTSDGHNLFYMKENKIRIKSENANLSLSIEDFEKLYKNVVFYLYKNDIEIDDNKDEDYYRFYKK